MSCPFFTVFSEFHLGVQMCDPVIRRPRSSSFSPAAAAAAAAAPAPALPHPPGNQIRATNRSRKGVPNLEDRGAPLSTQLETKKQLLRDSWHSFLPAIHPPEIPPPRSREEPHTSETAKHGETKGYSAVMAPFWEMTARVGSLFLTCPYQDRGPKDQCSLTWPKARLTLQLQEQGSQ